MMVEGGNIDHATRIDSWKLSTSLTTVAPSFACAAWSMLPPSTTMNDTVFVNIKISNLKAFLFKSLTCVKNSVMLKL